ncbi:LuxR C-terminal-related transcriptional regulator [Variovorax sp. J2P1-59]|uniref:LuxR C-terminal-related transcriptional regulator n=1 Tax=Variovorax flavidus TaxID=3053501 RepID=UPI002578CA0E|nr:LuxR C-terminal-related transcriptional regulator [Variovorax sp. J2P1-59]MDM0073757.1 LuxR C-terminal-related transcriptional regulator [Variovorax sp. J2P1-59]
MATFPGFAGIADELLLKVSPPRVPRHLVARDRLLSGAGGPLDCPVILVQAPAGFGKTSLLAQWRREHLAQGAVVAWLSAQEADEPRRLSQGLALAVRQAAGRPTFGHTLLEAPPGLGQLEGITVWLAEVAQTALNVVLMVDEADRLPAESRVALAYLMRNAPPNLRTVVATRVDCNLDIDDLIAYGQCAVVAQEMLRFRLEETLGLVRTRFAARVDSDAAARLHELTEGWPLGLQLALTVVELAADPRAEVLAMATHGGKPRDQLVGTLLANLAPDDLAFLTRISILDSLHAELCRSVAQVDDAAERLERMCNDTPVFITGEQGEWLRVHNLARDALRERFAMLPAGEQAQLHARAVPWLAERGRLEAAAGHALLAGQHDLAYELAERSLYESTMHGRVDAVVVWLERLPAAELDRRPRLLLAIAWALATSERHDDAGRLVARILALPGADDELRCECALILSGAAVFADEPDRFAGLHDPWAEAPPLDDPLLKQIHANRTAFRTLLAGDPALARLRQQQAPRVPGRRSPDYLSRWGEFIIALSYVWEGQVLLAENLLRPSLAGAEATLGRRSSFVVMLAALLASAAWERDRPGEAVALLANRLDVLERSGLPEVLLLSYRTLARIAVAEGAEHRAIELLDALHAVGVSRRLPRLRIASLAEQVRLHARHYRAQTCRELCDRIDAVLAEPGLPGGPLWRRTVSPLRELAQGLAAIAALDWRGAIEPLARADEVAQELKQGRLHIEIVGLRAFALDRRGEKSAQPMLREVAGLARAYGLLRVFEDAHPDLGTWAREIEGEGESAPPEEQRPAVPVRLQATPSTALTPKEREVLELLTRNLSNKEIALAMQVGEETIKWHMKNLFAKLDAGSRKQVVLRARILGLLQ